MRAAVRVRFGPPEKVEVRELDAPVPADDEVLVRVRAASLNAGDWYAATGRPWIARPSTGLRRPKSIRLGGDFAGVVEAVGKDVTRFRPGAEVFGARGGALAELVCVPESRAVAGMPAGTTFEEAAAVPIAAITALQGLREKGQLQPGQKVLVNGASGGVGTFAIQIAKALGAEVTAVCSARNVEAASSLGADRVVDYTAEDFTKSSDRYDLMLDIAGSRSMRACMRVLAREATVVVIGGSSRNRVLGPLGHVVGMKLGSIRSGRRSVFFIAKLEQDDLETLRELVESGKVKPAVEKRYELAEVADALRYMGEGPKGKLVVGC